MHTRHIRLSILGIHNISDILLPLGGNPGGFQRKKNHIAYGFSTHPVFTVLEL